VTGDADDVDTNIIIVRTELLTSTLQLKEESNHCMLYDTSQSASASTAEDDRHTCILIKETYDLYEF
jgi:hypothetical protein